MLPPALRMRRSADFTATVRGGARAGRGTVVVHCRVGDGRASGPDDVGAAEPQVGLVVGRTVGGAVVRNKVRRRLRGVVLEHRSSLPHGAALVVRALPAAADATYDRLREDLLGATRDAAAKARRRATAGGGPR